MRWGWGETFRTGIVGGEGLVVKDRVGNEQDDDDDETTTTRVVVVWRIPTVMEKMCLHRFQKIY